MRASPTLAAMAAYPFSRLEGAKQRVRDAGIELIDFGVGDPQEPTDPLIRAALVDGLRETSSYPLAVGLPALRESIAGWLGRRFGVAVDAESEIIPTYGSKEAIFSLALAVLDDTGGKDTVVVTEPGYPVPERGALFAGARVLRLPLLERNGFLPDLRAIGGDEWRRIALFWVNYPNNPTGAVAPLSFYEELAARAREHDFLLCSDEAYSELWFDTPPVSALQVADRRNIVAFNTLSKRSSMTGYRSGFVAGEADVIAALRAFRPTVGTAPQEFVQRASIAAWDDEGHVAAAQVRYGAKRQLMLNALEASAGLRVTGSEASFYLWVATRGGASSEEFAERLLERGIVVAPGSYLGPSGEGYVRFALVPPLEQCERAASILAELL
jgi:succinyldiaminopimelate transaminase